MYNSLSISGPYNLIQNQILIQRDGIIIISKFLLAFGADKKSGQHTTEILQDVNCFGKRNLSIPLVKLNCNKFFTIDIFQNSLVN